MAHLSTPRLVPILFALAAACGSQPETVHAPTQVAWAQAEALLLEGNVAEIVVRDAGEVRLDLTDGRRMVARVPAEGEIERVLERCGEPCAGVVVRRP